MKKPLRLSLLAFAAGDSKTAIARAASISSTYLSAVVNGHLVPGPRVLERLARHYGVAPDRLLDRVDLAALREFARK